MAILANIQFAIKTIIIKLMFYDLGFTYLRFKTKRNKHYC